MKLAQVFCYDAGRRLDLNLDELMLHGNSKYHFIVVLCMTVFDWFIFLSTSYSPLTWFYKFISQWITQSRVLIRSTHTDLIKRTKKYISLRHPQNRA